MKHLIISTLILLIALGAVTQNRVSISSRIIDKKTGGPLPYANIVYPSKSLGTISNSNGYFTFSLAGAQKTDSIIISYIGYKPLRTTISDCMERELIELKPLSTKIAEVEIKREKFKLKKFMQETIALYNKNRKKEPHIAIAHYREKVKADGKYVMYMESLGFSIFLAKQFNAAPLSNYKFFCKDSKCCVENPKWMSREKRVAKQGEGQIPNAGEANLNVFRYIEIDGILSSAQIKKYSFKTDTTYFVNNNYVIRVHFKGNGDDGTIDILSESKKILKISCSTKKQWSTISQHRERANITVQFNYFDDTHYISSIDSYYKYRRFEHFNTLTILVQKFNEFQLTKEEYWSLNNYSLNPYILYHDNIWSEFATPIDSDYKTIETDLTTDKYSLEEQFRNFSGQWFFPNKNKSELARKTIAGLEHNF